MGHNGGSIPMKFLMASAAALALAGCVSIDNAAPAAAESAARTAADAQFRRLGEPVWPGDWRPLIALVICGQLIGQGLLVFALKHFSPLVIGIALLTQPAVAALVGWISFGEVLTVIDLVGVALVASALVLAKVAQPSTPAG